MAPGPRGRENEVNEAEREVLLEFYGFVREEIVSESAHHNKRITQGLAVIGAILGYAVLTESLWVVAVTPFILGAILLQTEISVYAISKDARQLIEIESRLQSITDVATWETKYGGYYGTESTSSGSLLDVNRLPGLSLLLLTVISYALLAWFSLIFWSTSPELLQIVKTGDLFWAYVLFGSFVGVIGLLSLQYYRQMNPHDDDVDEDDRPAENPRSGDPQDDCD